MDNRVTINVRDKDAKVPIDTAFGSSLIEKRIELLGTDYVFPMPDKFYPVADNYINFLNGGGGLTEITTANKLEACFNMESYFDDKKYFQYLLGQLFDHWSTCGSAFLYGNINHDIRRNIFLWSHTPYDFVPIEYIDNIAFFRSWLTNNKNTNVIVDYITNQNNNKVTCKLYFTATDHFDTDDGIVKKIITYHTEMDIEKGNEKGNEIGHKNVIYYNDDGSIDVKGTYYDGSLQDGVERLWYENFPPLPKTLKLQTRKVNYDLDSDQLTWYNNDSSTNDKKQLLSNIRYSNDRLDGISTWYYEDGRKSSEIHYNNGKEHGIELIWSLENLDTNYYLKTYVSYDNGKLHGPYKIWYIQDQLEYDGQYVDDKSDGLWIPPITEMVQSLVKVCIIMV